MEKWQDQGIVLAVRPHGENGAVVSLLTESQGRHAGYVRGAQGSRMRGMLEAGNLVDANWQARVSDDLGAFSLELSSSPAAHFMQDALKLAALQSACVLCDAALPEREGHPGLFHGLGAFINILTGSNAPSPLRGEGRGEGDEESDSLPPHPNPLPQGRGDSGCLWGAAYVMWEVAFLKELGFSLDLSKCAGGGDSKDLAYVSPKTGRAVSAEAGEPYKDKLLQLPGFLSPAGGSAERSDVLRGLELTGYFLEHWAFVHHTKGMPEERLRFQVRYASNLKKQNRKSHV